MIMCIPFIIQKIYSKKSCRKTKISTASLNNSDYSKLLLTELVCISLVFFTASHINIEII